ncbi:MAG: M12 family metallo-peptidase [Phycisphaerales bacterium]
MNPSRQIWGAVAGLCCAATVMTASASTPGFATMPAAAQLRDDLDQQIKAVFDVKSYTLQLLNVPATADAPATIRVKIAGRDMDLALAPNTLRGDGFQVLVDDGSGQLQRVEPPARTTMRGDVLQDPNSRVRASLIHGGLRAWIDLGDDTVWAIQQVSAEIPGVDPRLHVIYRDREIAPVNGRCGVDDFVKPAFDGDGRGAGIRPVGGTSDPAPRTTGDRIADIAFDADVEYYALNGNNVNNVVNDIESIMNAVEGIYENNTDISYEVTTIVVRTAEPDPYSSTDPGTLLNQFDSHWSSQLGSIRRDVAHLFTGKNVDGSVIGIANLSAICDAGRGYGLSQSRYTTNLTLRRSLTAHELGHNWSAQHCDNSGTCNIMCSCNGCGPPACTGIFTSFGAGEAAQIVAYRNTRTCLTTEPAPVATPFSDDFPATALDATKWVYNDGAVTSTASVNPPSSPRAVQLNAIGAGDYDDDDLRTGFIELVGVSNPRLSYYVQARGVPAGGQLFVDVWLSSLRWVNVNTITSDGVDDAAFTQYTTNLLSVSGAIHNEFRVRFRPDVSLTTQNWYIDNVYVGPPQGPLTGACCLSNGSCVEATSADCAAQGGNYQGDLSTCGGTVCPQPPGACCLEGGGCITTVNLAICLASGGVWQGHGTSCASAGCPEPPGACCLPSGSCVEVADAAACAAMGGQFQGAGVLCGGVSCPQPLGACCLPSGDCIQVDMPTCTAQGGTFSGSGTTCGGVNCPQPAGACCLPSGVCVQTDAAGCAAQSGTFNGAGTNCGSTQCPQPCPCNWNGTGGVDSQDFFDFVAGFFGGNADYNTDGETNSQDFFDFLGCFFSPPAGC